MSDNLFWAYWKAKKEKGKFKPIFPFTKKNRKKASVLNANVDKAYREWQDDLLDSAESLNNRMNSLYDNACRSYSQLEALR